MTPNKFISHQKINPFEIVNISAVKIQYKIEEFFLEDFSVGYDDAIYLLFSKELSNDEEKFFPYTKTKTQYAVICIVLDWERKIWKDITCYNLGTLNYCYSFLRPFKESFLLLGSRCGKYKDGSADNNALLIKKDSTIKKELCLGDGIEDCLTTSDGKIIVSYFDEGIFGNYGWDTPVGASGLIVWDENGILIWKNQIYNIYDCYAMNVDTMNRLWFYYYDNFDLVCTDFKTDIVMQPNTEGCGELAISETLQQIIMSGGYKDNSFYIYSFDNTQGKIDNFSKDKLTLELGNIEIYPIRYKFSYSKLLFMNEDKIYGYYFR